MNENNWHFITKLSKFEKYRRFTGENRRLKKINFHRHKMEQLNEYTSTVSETTASGTTTIFDERMLSGAARHGINVALTLKSPAERALFVERSECMTNDTVPDLWIMASMFKSTILELGEQCGMSEEAESMALTLMVEFALFAFSLYDARVESICEFVKLRNSLLINAVPEVETDRAWWASDSSENGSEDDSEQGELWEDSGSLRDDTFAFGVKTLISSFKSIMLKAKALHETSDEIEFTVSRLVTGLAPTLRALKDAEEKYARSKAAHETFERSAAFENSALGNPAETWTNWKRFQVVRPGFSNAGLTSREFGDYVTHLILTNIETATRHVEEHGVKPDDIYRSLIVKIESAREFSNSVQSTISHPGNNPEPTLLANQSFGEFSNRAPIARSRSENNIATNQTFEEFIVRRNVPTNQTFEEFLTWSYPQGPLSCQTCKNSTSQLTKCGHRACIGCINQSARKHAETVACPLCHATLFSFKRGENLLHVSANAGKVTKIVDLFGLNALCTIGILVVCFPTRSAMSIVRNLVVGEMSGKKLAENAGLKMVKSGCTGASECSELCEFYFRSQGKLARYIFGEHRFDLFPYHDLHGEGRALIAQHLNNGLFPASLKEIIDFFDACIRPNMKLKLVREFATFASMEIDDRNREFTWITVAVTSHLCMFLAHPRILNKLRMVVCLLIDVLCLAIVVLQAAFCAFFGGAGLIGSVVRMIVWSAILVYSPEFLARSYRIIFG